MVFEGVGSVMGCDVWCVCVDVECECFLVVIYLSTRRRDERGGEV